MKRLPHMPLFVDDFEADTAHLSFEEDGAYNRLLRLCWRQSDCSVPDDRAWLMRRLRTDAKTFDRLIAPIIDEFFRREGGRIWQKRQRKEHAYITERVERRSAAGKKGAEAKWLKSQCDDDGNRMAIASEPHSDGDDSGGGGAEATAPEPQCDPNDKSIAPIPIPIPIVREDSSAAVSTPPVEIAAAAPDPSPDFHDRILAAARIDTSSDISGKWFSSTQRWTSSRWLDLVTEAEAITVVGEIASRNRRAPGSLAYFDRAIQELAGRKAAGPLTAIAPTARGPAPADPDNDPEMRRLQAIVARYGGANG